MRRLAIDFLDRFIAVKFSCLHSASCLYVRANLRYFSTSRSAQPTYRNQSFQVPVGNNGYVSLNVTYPSIAPAGGKPNVIIRLPPGPFFQREAEHGESSGGPYSETLARPYLKTKKKGVSAVKKQVFYRYPTPVHDTLAGFDWVQQNLQPARLGVIGTRIGGSLALMLALTEAQSVHAVTALEPICDWPGLDEHCLMEEQPAHEGNTASKRTRGAGSRVPAAQDLVPLLEAREKFFASPERYFDAFASPVLFLRSAGKDVPRTFPKYRTGPDYPVPVLVSSKPDRQPIGVWDPDTQDQAIHQQGDIYDSETDLPSDPDSDTKSRNDPADASFGIQGRAIRRRKALSRWPPYGLDYGSSVSHRYHIYNQGIKRLEMALPNVRLFVRAHENENEQPDPVPASDGDGKRQAPRHSRKTQRRSVLAQQADEMVDVMRRACFWGREKGYGESRVTLAQVPPGSGEEGAGRWLGETLLSKDPDANN
ncbi:uncharacterized protein NFIA_053660 [Aspergillus fischeri NRRL 181]|uniref:Uncharacterized protein n=1 Tax=Neosartorya fischeri (strain ATCC 1020 / DSM 3700 / CBS 544.65 / FGSC A1164 / JCM 1740 / NRRL 181 / WB 181) TaxID=331117 RepID=A1DMJ9_NEOFI|nr:conserved hypothetical protein [Aspergillus fischeri NRRL 181]EAW16020.1 conserved hypothetical protein [Aspergillus fischeri NRRL 181]